MRHSAAVVLALSALLGSTAIPAHAQDQPTQQNAAPAPEKGDNPAAAAERTDQNRKTSGTNDQSGPDTGTAATPNSQGDQATHSVSGRQGKQEPGSHAPTQNPVNDPVLVNGALNVPGALSDSQTVPAKFSKRNDGLDRLPTMAVPTLGLSEQQKNAIAASVKTTNPPVQATNAKPAEELPWNVTVHDLGISASDPALARVKVVRAQDRILLIDAPNRTVIGEIKN